jgi:uncharacterized protein (DUF305 family)
MKNESLLYGIGGLLLGMVLSMFTASYAVNNNSSGMMRAFGMHGGNNGTYTSMMGSNSDRGMSMDDMMSGLSNKTGDNFDKVFLSEMIIHHQGAIDMAKEARTSAKHQEIKDLAGNIITAQQKEIDQMHGWQTQWGY